MSVDSSINGVSYSLPETGENNWGTVVTNYLVAVGDHLLQKTGGSFTLSAEVDFGATYGLKSVYFKSRAGSPGSTGVLRLGNNESIVWRNAGDDGDIGFKVDGSDEFVFGSTALTEDEIGYLAGVSSGLQAQLAGKADLALSNLASVAVAATLNPSINQGIEVGSDALEWDKVWTRQVQHNDTTSPNLDIGTTGNNGDVVLSAHGTGKVTASSPFEVTGTSSYVKFPSMTEAQRDALTASNGMEIYNTDTSRLEAYQNGAWGPAGSGSGGTGQNFVSNPLNADGATSGTSGSANATFADYTSADRIEGDKSFQLSASTPGRHYWDFELDTIGTHWNDQNLVWGFSANVKNLGSSTYTAQLYNKTGVAAIGNTYAMAATGKYEILGGPVTVADVTDDIVVRIWADDANSTSSTDIIVDKVNFGPDKVVKGESIAEKIRVSYRTNAGLAVNTTTKTRIDFEDKEYDEGHTSDTVTTGSGWVFTAPRAGVYAISAGAAFGSLTASTSHVFVLYLHKNGSQISFLDYISGVSGSGVYALQGKQDVELAAGDTISLHIYQTAVGTANLQTNDDFNFVTITEVTDHKESRFGVNSDVEYVYNTDTTSTAIVTTGSATGSGGGNFSANWVVGTTYERRVTFSSPILPTDTVVIQLSRDSGVTWSDYPDAFNGSVTSYIQQSSNIYGIYYSPVSSTQVDVKFASGGRLANSTYGANGAGFDGLSADNFRWRVVKSANPLGIGVPLIAQDQAGVFKPGQQVGYTGGSAIGAGSVGELTPGGTLTSDTNAFTYKNSATTGLSGIYASLVSITLTPGVWLVSADAKVSGSAPQTDHFVGTTSGGLTSAQRNDGTSNHGVSFSLPVVITSEQAISLYGRVNSGSVSSATQEIFAVRIA